MNEVERLYSLAGVEKEFEQPAECRKNPYITCDGCMLYDNGKCLNKKDYPPFTADKQIELIKWIANRKGYPDYEYFGNLFDDYIQLREFDEALAQLINDLWQYLTADEQNEIKNILK